MAGCPGPGPAPGPGGAPGPTASMAPPTTSTQPGDSTPPGVATGSAAMITRGPPASREDHRAGQGTRVVGVDSLAGGQRDRQALRPGQRDQRVPAVGDDQGAGAGGVLRQGLRDVSDPPH